MENTFTNRYTGEIEERQPYGLYANIWLSKTEANNLQKYCLKNNKDFETIIDEVDTYLESYPDKKDYVSFNSVFYVRSWVTRQLNYKPFFNKK